MWNSMAGRVTKHLVILVYGTGTRDAIWNMHIYVVLVSLNFIL